MKIIGNELILIKDYLELSKHEIENRITSCPDMRYHSEEIKELNKDLSDIKKLLIKIEKNIKEI